MTLDKKRCRPREVVGYQKKKRFLPPKDVESRSNSFPSFRNRGQTQTKKGESWIFTKRVKDLELVDFGDGGDEKKEKYDKRYIKIRD